MTVSSSQQPTPLSIPNIAKAIPTPIDHNYLRLSKRQRNHQQQEDPGQQADKVVHVTVTESGTVVYTYTATSFSYIPSYSTITDNNSTNNNNSSASSSGQEDASSSSSNIGAIVGGVVGGVTFIALIGLIFFFIKRSQKKKKRDFHEEYQANKNNNMPRPFVTPFIQNDSDGEGGYYEDVISTSYPGTHFSLPAHTATTDSLSSGNMAASSQQHIYQVPNEIDYPQMQERHVPHLKENEPPHLKD